MDKETRKVCMETAEAKVLDIEERRWLPEHCRGDKTAFPKLIQAYKGLIYTFLHRYGIEAEARDDLFQEIFFKIHQSAYRYRPSQPLGPWLLTIALNSIRNARRDKARRLQAQRNIPKPQAAYEPGADQVNQDKDTLYWLQSEIHSMKDVQKEVLVLCTLKGISIKDVAKTLAMPENTVKTHLRRARLALADALVKREAAIPAPGNADAML